MKKYLLDRLKERSTWLGLVGFLAVVGVALSPDQVESIATAGVAMAAAVAVFFPDVPPVSPA